MKFATNMKRHWTDNVAVNQKFLRALREEALGSVSNKTAYQIYARNCADRKTYIAYDPTRLTTPKVKVADIVENEFLQMNVRNQLCKLEHLGILERTMPGQYVWVPKHK